MTLTLEQIAVYEERLSRAYPDFGGHAIPALDAVYWVLRDMLTNERYRLENEEQALREGERPTPPGHDTAIEALPREDGGGVGG